MKNVFVSTSHVGRFTKAAAALEPRFTDAERMGIGLIQGNPGKGKTKWKDHYDALCRKFGRIRSVALMAKKIWTPTSMLKDLNAKLGGACQSFRKDLLFDEVERQLKERPALVLIDQAHVVARSDHMMGILQDLHDLTHSCILFFGEIELKRLVMRFQAFFNRVNTDAIVTAGENTVDDVIQIISARCEVQVEQDVCRAIYDEGGQQSFRYVINQIRGMEDLSRQSNLELIGTREYEALKREQLSRKADKSPVPSAALPAPRMAKVG